MTAAAAPTGWDAVRTYLDGGVALYEELPWMLDDALEYRHMRLPDDADVTVGEEIVAAPTAKDRSGPTSASSTSQSPGRCSPA